LKIAFVLGRTAAGRIWLGKTLWFAFLTYGRDTMRPV